MDKFLTMLRTAKFVVIDLETNSLNAFDYNSRILGYALYLPEYSEGRYYPFNHGVGRFEVEYSGKNTAQVPFARMTWQGDTKKAIWLNYWWDKWRREQPEVFGNLPAELEDEIISALNDSAAAGATWIFHNAQFDLSWLANKGITISDNVYDTMIGMHIVHEDMGGIKVNAPYKYTKKEATAGKGDVGAWARTPSGNLSNKLQFGNYQLKWLCAYLGFDGAAEGEDGLAVAADRAIDSLSDFISERASDTYNAGLIPAKLKQTALDKLTGYLDKKANMWTIPADGVAPYALLDVELTWKLFQWLQTTLETWDNLPLFKQQCDILRFVTWPVYYKGVRIDVKAAQTEAERLTMRQGELLKYMHTITGRYDFNPGSGKQILEVISKGVLKKLPSQAVPEWWDDETRSKLQTYRIPRVDVRKVVNEAGKEVLLRTEVNVTSTAAEVLEEFGGHPFIVALFEYRKLGKAIGTYLTRWLQNRDGNGIIHPSLKITGTVSGRLSSSGEAGNFQNIPDRNGYEMKRALIPTKSGYVVVGIDYGQLELRLATWLAEIVHGFDSTLPMTTLFENDIDMHSWLRDEVNIRGIVYPEMTDEQIVHRLGYNLHNLPKEAPTPELVVLKQCRFIAKTMNFGLLYGGGAGMLSKLLKIDHTTAQTLVVRWRGLFPAFQIANRYYTDEALKWRPKPKDSDSLQQFVTQPFTNRHRRFSHYSEWVEYVDPKTGEKSAWSEKSNQANKAWNNVVQGLGGEMAKYASLEIVKRFPQVDVFNIVHDSIDLFVPETEMYDIIPVCQSIMQDWNVRPGLTTDVVAGNNWQDVMKLSEWREIR